MDWLMFGCMVASVFCEGMSVGVLAERIRTWRKGADRDPS